MVIRFESLITKFCSVQDGQRDLVILATSDASTKDRDEWLAVIRLDNLPELIKRLAR